jgi:hypothetical protein
VNSRPHRVLWLVLPLVLLCLNDEAAGQPASPPLPAGHWSESVLARWEALGLLAPEHLPPQRLLSRTVAEAALQQAVERARERDPAMAPAAIQWLQRFHHEFSETAPGGGATRAALAAGYERRSAGEPPTALPREPLLAPADDRIGAYAAGSLSVRPTRGVALAAEPVARPGGITLERWSAAVLWGPVELSAGREAIGYGFGAERGLLLSGSTGLHRLQAQTVRPLRLPGVLRHAGPVAAHAFLTRLDEARHQGDPWLWGASASLRPHPRLTLGLHRAAMFGGGEVEVNAQRVGRMLIGITSDGFDNQVVSASFRFRAPTERVLPLSVYGEWGADDTAGALYDAPGYVFGALLPRLPGAPSLAVGAEHAYFGNRCRDCRRIAEPLHWYTHFRLTGGWVSGDHPLGHPLGGNGTETRVYAYAGALRARLHLRGDLFQRDRLDSNLYAPRWSGRSRGGGVSADWRLTDRAAARLRWAREGGDGWSAHELRSSFSVEF